MRHVLLIGASLLALNSCGTPKPTVPKTNEHAQAAGKVVDLTSSAQWRAVTTRLGQRTAFLIAVCAGRQSSLTLGDLYAYVEQAPQAQPPWLLQAAGTRWGDEPADTDDDSARKRDADLHCTTLAGALNIAGPLTFLFARIPSSSSRPGRVLARLPITLPEPTNDPRVLRVIGNLLVEHAPEDAERRQSQAVATFSGFRAPAAFGADQTYRGSTNPRTRSLYDVFAGAADLPRSVGLRAFARELDPAEPDSVLTDAVVAFEHDDVLGRRLPSSGPAAPEIIARWVPRDAAVIRFQSLDKLLELLERGDELGSGLAMSLWRDARDHALRERYTSQLGLELRALKSLASQGAFDDVALLTHDGNLRDGTDVSLVLHHPASKAGTQQQLTAMVKSAADRLGVPASTLQIGGHSVTVYESANHRLRSFAYFEGRWSLLSNSRTAIERVLATHDGRRPLLANEPDYRYLATIGKAGDGVAFVGQGFLDVELGPARSVAHRRRLLCTAQMQLLSGAILAYKRERGTLPSMSDLQKQHYLRHDDLHCPDGGNITISDNAPACSVHGSLAALNPVIEHLPERIKPSERDGYLERYRTLQYGSEFLPTRVDIEVGAEIVAKGHTLAGRRSLMHQVYRTAFSAWPAKLESVPALPTTLAAFSFSLNLDDPSFEHGSRSVFSRMLAIDERLRATGPYAINRWATGQASLYFQDGEPAVTFSFEDLGFLIELGDPVVLNALGAALTMPFYGTVTLKDPELAGHAMDALLGPQSLSVPFLRVKQETYDLIAYRGFAVHVLSVHLGPVELHVFHSLLGKEFVWSPRKSIILKVIDHYLDAPKNAQAHVDTDAHAVVDVFPDAFQRARDTVETAWQERLRRACHEHLEVFESLRQAYGAEKANNDDLARAHFGYAARCPEGGTYKFDPLEGGTTCTVHGRPGRARQPAHLSPVVESGRAIHPLDRVRVELTAKEHTLETELRIHRHL